MFIRAFGVKYPDSIGLVDKAEQVNARDIKCTWYNMGECKSFLKTLERGDEITVETNAKKVILSAKKVGAVAKENKFYGKSPEEQQTIKRQAIGHMVSRTIIGLQGSVDVNNVLPIIDTLYKKYTEVVG